MANNGKKSEIGVELQDFTPAGVELTPPPEPKKAEPTEKARRIVKEAEKRTPNIKLERAISEDTRELARGLMERGERVFVRAKDGETRSARVVSLSEGGITLVYRENGRAVVETKTFDEFTADQESVSPEQELKESSLDAGERALEGAMDRLEAMNKEVFDTVTKSKWLLAGRVGRYFTRALGAGAESAAGVLVADAKNMLVGSKNEAIDLDEGETAETVGTRGAFGAGMEMLWGLPKNLIKGIETLEKEGAEISAAQIDTYEHLREQRGAFERIRTPYEILKNVTQFLSNDIARPVLKGNLEMVSYLQDKLTGNTETTIELGEEMQSLEELDADIEFYGMELDQTVAEENEKLDAVITGNRLEKLKIELAKSLTAREKAKLKTGGAPGEQLKTILALTEKIDAQKKAALEEIQALEEAKKGLKEVEAIVAA